MQNINFEKFSFYYYYVSSLIYNFHFDSIFKISIISLILNYKITELSSCRSKNDVLDIFFSTLRPVLFSSNDDFRLVFQSLEVLKKAGFIETQSDSIKILKKMEKIPNFYKGKMLFECLDSLSLMSTKSFVGEVLYYV